jgi:hypothetical protein
MKPLFACVVCVGFAMSASLSAAAADTAKGESGGMAPSAPSTIEQPPPFLGRGVLLDVTAKVTAINRKHRLVTLVGPAGREVTVKAGDQVRNLRQLRVGDRVHVKYYVGSVVDLIPPGEKAQLGVKVQEGAARAPLGAKPAGIVAQETTATVKILGVDPYKKTIAFRGGDGRYREVSMKGPHLEHYLKEVKAGDTVQVVYTEALAVAVTPAKK